MRTIIYTLGYILVAPFVLLKCISAVFGAMNEWSNKILGKIMFKNLMNEYKTTN